MKTRFYIAVLMTTYIIPTTCIASYQKRHGVRNECWYEEDYGKKKTNNNWAYHYCGKQEAKCNGKKSKGHDLVVWQYHGDKFTFKDNSATYFCCGGTTDNEGKYVQGNNWIISTQTEKKSVNGGTCNKLFQQDICGGTHEQDCTEPDSCNAGQIIRNGACVTTCTGDEVFESTTSNNCIKCETNLRQGPSEDHTACIKCDATTEVFDRDTKKCTKKTEMTQHTNESMYECWACPQDLFRKCLESVSKVNKMGLSGERRMKEIDAIAALDDNVSIVKKCHLDK